MCLDMLSNVAVNTTPFTFLFILIPVINMWRVNLFGITLTYPLVDSWSSYKWLLDTHLTAKAFHSSTCVTYLWKNHWYLNVSVCSYPLCWHPADFIITAQLIHMMVGFSTPSVVNAACTNLCCDIHGHRKLGMGTLLHV